MPNVEHPVNYRRAVLHELAAPSSVAAIPNLTDITQQHAAAQGKIAVLDQGLKSDVSFAENKLSEQNRQFMERLSMDRQMLDTWAEQNKWATNIAIANLGVQALGIPAQMKTLEKKEASEKAIAARMNEAVDLRKLAAAEEKRRWDKFLGDQQQQNTAAIRRLYKVNTGNAAGMNSPYE